MTRRALPPIAEPQVVTGRQDEATGERPSSKLLSARAAVAPCTLARGLLHAGRARDALPILEREIEGGNDSAEAQFLIGCAAFHLGQHERAQQALSRAVAQAPQDAESYRWLARVLLRRGNPAAALRVLSSASRSCVPPAPRAGEQAVPFDVRNHVDAELAAEDMEPPTAQWVRSRGRPSA